MTQVAWRRMSRWRRHRTRRQREDLLGRVLISPTLLVVVALVILPFLAVVLFAFTDTRLVDIPRISPGTLDVTIANFTRVIRSATFWGALRTTTIYATLTTLGAIVCGTAIAVALRRPFPGRGLLRASVLVPYVLPVVAGTTIWKVLLNTQYGLVNAIGTRHLGWDGPIGFLSTTQRDVLGVPVPVALLTVVVFEVWKTAPLAFLFVTARLQAIPADLEEAASVDGASLMQQFRYIILPQLRGVILLLTLLRFIWSFQSFNEIYLLTAGAGGTEVMAVKVYTELITRANISSAAAYGLVMTVILSVFLYAYFRIVNRRGAPSWS